jgi:hypothetical protein
MRKRLTLQHPNTCAVQSVRNIGHDHACALRKT